MNEWNIARETQNPIENTIQKRLVELQSQAYYGVNLAFSAESPAISSVNTGFQSCFYAFILFSDFVLMYVFCVL